MRGPRTQRGFTLLELMIAVAIVGVLAAVLVMAFTKPANKVKTGSEVPAMFAVFHSAEQSYAVENGVYLSTGADESAIHPTTPGSRKQALGALPTTWQSLRIVPTTENVYCGYVAVAGTAAQAIPNIASATFGMAQPTTSWYVLVAKCDIDGDGTDFSYYLSSSVDTSVKKVGEGQ